MDGVLVDIESSWLFVHKKLNVNSSENYQMYCQRKISYKDFMRRDIRLWGKRHVNEIKRILNTIPLMNGFENTINELRRNFKLAIISAGISLLADRLNNDISFDYVFANKLCTDEEGYLTGEGEVIVELLKKELALDDLCKNSGISPDQCAAIGDSSFDVPIFENVGFSIAFNVTDKSLIEKSDKLVEIKDLRAILPILEHVDSKSE
jgi:phosphoserine phosphatase